MNAKTARVLFSSLLVVALGVVCAPTLGAAPGVSPGSGTREGGTRVSGMIPSQFVTVAGSREVAYALDDEGAVWAWGDNNSGRLGNGTTNHSTRPTRVKPSTGTLPVFTAIAGGNRTGYALDEDGGVWAWGNNSDGKLGNGTTDEAWNPVQVKAASGDLPVFTAIAARYNTAYALDKWGEIWAWGYNGHGELGNGGTAGQKNPVQVTADSGSLPVFTAIAAGRYAGYALDKWGEVWAWGYNMDGQLGDGTTSDSLNPVQVKAAVGVLPVITAIAAGNHTGYALDKDGGVWAWGYNGNGELGNGGTTNSLGAVRVQPASGPLREMTAITAGSSTGYALDKDGGVWAWGDNTSGQLGIYSSSPWMLSAFKVRTASGALPAIAAIGAGENTGYALDRDGALWAWGGGATGQFGNGEYYPSETAVQVSATLGKVTFGGVEGESPAITGRQWSATTPTGCGRVPVVVTYGLGEVADRTATVGTFDFGKPPSVTAQPGSGRVVAGGTFTATVGVSGDPVPAVRWQSRIGVGAWADIPGVTGLTLTARPTVSTEYRAVATNCWSEANASAFTAYSATASATVAPPNPLPPPDAPKAAAVAMAMKQVTMTTKTSLKVVSLVYPVGVKAKVSWTSSKPKVAKVNSSGKIQALKPGRAVITAKTENGKTARLKVTVVAKAVKVKAIKAAKTSTIKVKKGKSTRLSVQLTPAGSTLTKMPTFLSSKPKVASIDKTGLITAKAKGKTTITVRQAGKKTTLLINVT
ncbi:MAG: Ig-like domain-containing protein [Micrococcales bacterium]|nr:Ig-like domain-containing protein [Micrococcales bacterium]